MAKYFEINKNEGQGNSTITVTPSSSYKGREIVTNNIIVTAKDYPSVNDTCVCTIDNGILVDGGKVNQIVGNTSSSIELDGTDILGGTLISPAASKVETIFSTNSSRVQFDTHSPDDLISKVTIEVTEQGSDEYKYVQVDGTLGTDIIDWNKEPNKAFQLSPDLGSSMAYTVKTTITLKKSNFDTADNKLNIDFELDAANQIGFSLKLKPNTKNYADPVITGGGVYGDILAKGSTVTPTPITYKQTWGWGDSTTDGGTITSGGTVVYTGADNTSTGAVSATTLGTTEKARTKVKDVTAKVTLNGKSVTKVLTVYQEANTIESYSTVVANVLDPEFTFTSAGGTKSILDMIEFTQNAIYTSEATKPVKVTNITSEVATSATGFSLDNNIVTATANTTVLERGPMIVEVTGTANGKSATEELEFNQNSGDAVVTVEPKTLTWGKFDKDAQTIEVTSNTDWTVTIKE